MSCEYVTTLCKSLCQEIPCTTEQEHAKLESCLAGLSTVTATMGAVVEFGLEQLRVSAIKPRIAPWVDTFLTLSHHLTEVSSICKLRIKVYILFACPIKNVSMVIVSKNLVSDS